MTAEEFFKSKGFYSADTEYSKQFFGEILEIAEAYAKQENEALKKKVEELKEALISYNELMEKEDLTKSSWAGLTYSQAKQALKE